MNSSQKTNFLIFCLYISFMNYGFVTSDGTKVLTVAEYDRFVNSIPVQVTRAQRMVLVTKSH